MQNTNHKKFLRILAMILVLVMTLCCLAACGNDNDRDDDKDDAEDTKSSSKLVSYQWKGLMFQLSSDYQDMSGSDYGFYKIDTASLCVSDATTPNGVTDSQSYANHYKNTKINNYESLSVNSQNGVYYAVGNYDDGTKEVRGFYVNGDHCWMMYISCYTENYSDDFVSVVTSGKIDKSYQYTPGNANTQQPGTTDTPDNNNNNNNNNNNTPQQPSTPSLKQHSYEGLTYKLGEDYTATDNGGSILYSNGSTAIIVTGGETPNNITNSSNFADFFISSAEASGYFPQKGSYNGISYTVTDWNDGTIEVRSYYVYNGYGWSIYATTEKYAIEGDLLVQYVTSGVIDKNYDHSNSGNNNGSQPEINNGSSDNNAGRPQTPTPAPTPDDGTIYVYTLVPNSWGAPCCWAWNNATQKNAYDVWPGQNMKWDGKYYVTTAPDWVDYVIINGNSGSIQTDDIAINSGCDVWVIIHADGEWYTMLYNEPTASELANMGY